MTGARPDTWMPFYVGDYLRDTGHLSPAEHGAYLLLILHYWVSGKPLPDNDNYLRRVARMTSREWDVSRETLAGFFTVAEGIWQHGRVDKELTRALGLTEDRSKAGSKGAAKRWQGHSNGMAKPMASGQQNDAPSPSQSQKEEDTATNVAVTRPAKTDLATWRFDTKAIQICLDANCDPGTTNDHINDWGINAKPAMRYRPSPHAFLRNWFKSPLNGRPVNGAKKGTTDVHRAVFGEFDNFCNGNEIENQRDRSSDARALPSPERRDDG